MNLLDTVPACIPAENPHYRNNSRAAELAVSLLNHCVMSPVPLVGNVLTMSCLLRDSCDRMLAKSETKNKHFKVHCRFSKSERLK